MNFFVIVLRLELTLLILGRVGWLILKGGIPIKHCPSPKSTKLACWTNETKKAHHTSTVVSSCLLVEARVARSK
jgi:hypothetical protein